MEEQVKEVLKKLSTERANKRAKNVDPRTKQ